MKIERNSRQVPKTSEITANSKYFDILYAHLQIISEWDQVDGHFRRIPRKEINFTRLGKILGLSRQTIAKKFNNLIALGLVIEVEGGDYELPILKDSIAFLLPYDTLRILTNTLNEKTISVYTYLINRFYANNCKEFQVTYTQLKAFCGVGTKTRSNDYIIADILTVLKKLELIDFDIRGIKVETGNFKDCIFITQVSNKIKC